MRRALALTVVALALAALVVPSASAAPAPAAGPSKQPAPTRAASRDVPLVFAYYYIWFNPTSWQRAKRDQPALGAYSSDERRIMEQHVKWAKAAGIDAFLVSWKHTESLDYRLERLAEVARELDFKLGIVYQGLDFERQPLPTSRVASDIAWLADRYGDDPTFHLLGERPLVMWSGTWKFSQEDIASTSALVRPSVTLLASERNADDYLAVAQHFDGNSYYWASVNPSTYPRYRQKLQSMGEAVHETGGIWIAPFAPGFDARLVGGSSVVPRRDGDVLRTEWSAALASSPDALGLISWNEFSENTFVEPSDGYGRQYLEAVADLTGSPGPTGQLDSSGPENTQSSSNTGAIALAVFVGLGVVGIGVISVRRRRQLRDGTTELGRRRNGGS